MATHVGLVQALWTGAEARSVSAAIPRGTRGGSGARSRSIRHAPRPTSTSSTGQMKMSCVPTSTICTMRQSKATSAPSSTAHLSANCARWHLRSVLPSCDRSCRRTPATGPRARWPACSHKHAVRFHRGIGVVGAVGADQQGRRAIGDAAHCRSSEPGAPGGPSLVITFTAAPRRASLRGRPAFLLHGPLHRCWLARTMASSRKAGQGRRHLTERVPAREKVVESPDDLYCLCRPGPGRRNKLCCSAWVGFGCTWRLILEGFPACARVECHLRARRLGRSIAGHGTWAG